jgi:hypothetical protein
MDRENLSTVRSQVGLDKTALTMWEIDGLEGKATSNDKEGK